MDGRPQIVVYQQRCIQINVAPYSAWRVDHKSWSTYKEIGRTIRGKTFIITSTANEMYPNLVFLTLKRLRVNSP